MSSSVSLGRSPHGERGLKLLGRNARNHQLPSLSSRRAWIEMSQGGVSDKDTARRSPHGERGLKSGSAALRRPSGSRSPHGERGLKSDVHVTKLDRESRSPHGERGLKWQLQLSQSRKYPCRSPHGERGLKCGRYQLEPLRHVALLTESVD